MQEVTPMRHPRWLPKFRRARESCPECGASVPATYCEVCGYDLIKKTRAEAGLHRPPT
jgi:predicted amidophosphoribosyltransferase